MKRGQKSSFLSPLPRASLACYNRIINSEKNAQQTKITTKHENRRFTSASGMKFEGMIEVEEDSKTKSPRHVDSLVNIGRTGA